MPRTRRHGSSTPPSVESYPQSRRSVKSQGTPSRCGARCLCTQAGCASVTVKRTAAPSLYRVLIPAKDLEQSRVFYESLLATRSRLVGGGRVYFDCGPVILGVLEYSTASVQKFPKPAEALYFATHHLEEVFQRASKLGCLTPGLLHDDPSSPLGEIVVRPWGERSFYADDPSGNPLCFVDANTLFKGSPHQVATLRRRYDPTPRRSRARSSARKRME
jgi:hypothetical protein